MEVQYQRVVYATAVITRPDDEVPEASEEYRRQRALPGAPGGDRGSGLSRT